MNKLVSILTACALLSGCVQAPPPPVVAYHPYPRPHTPPRVHHARRKTPGSTSAQVATDCPWPAHVKLSAEPRLETASTQVAVAADAAEDTVEGCAVLRFGVSKEGTVSYIDVVAAKPEAVAPVALKCLLAARFRPSSHPDEDALVRVEMRSQQPDLVVASLRVR